jgi:23S rRNA (guanine2445-N2)-methyltransferase / 23S rRNA (guanine2069-N7)-methyltransferase
VAYSRRKQNISFIELQAGSMDTNVPRTAKADYTMNFYATCPTGFEHLLGQELASFNTTSVRPLTGMVSFGGELVNAYRACMWSRMASSIVAVIDSFDIDGAQALYDRVNDMPWEEHMAPNATFAIYTTGETEGLENTLFTSQKVKDAIVDRFFAKYGTRPDVDTKNPDIRIRVRLRQGHASIGIDLAGEPLFKRGYERQAARKGPQAAIMPLRADYAAALLFVGKWYATIHQDEPTLVCPTTGNGTLLAEAAAIALDRAPGLLRIHWGFEKWLQHKPSSWSYVEREATKRRESGAENRVRLVATDTRPGFATAARALMRGAGIDVEPEFFSAKDATSIAQKLKGENEKARLFVADLSWIRSHELAREAEVLSMLTALCSNMPATQGAAYTKDRAIGALLGLEPKESFEVMAGKSEAWFDTFENVAVTEAQTLDVAGTETSILVPASDQFAARLAKVAKLRKKWAEEEDITCYRIYDADLPDYNVSLDIYEGDPQTPGRWLVASEYAAPAEVEADLAQRRLIDILSIAPKILDVKPMDIALRIRSKEKGGSQYAAPESFAAASRGKKEPFEDRRAFKSFDLRNERGWVRMPPGSKLIDEGGLVFEVNFEERLDCGIFLDTREVRSEIRELMKQAKGSKRFLNLFAYTGTATCYAADGGAKYTTTVDMNRNYLAWAERNMNRNGFTGEQHEYECSDVIDWVNRMRKTRNRWDVVYCDPPTFSNSKSMYSKSWDVQRDHAELLIGISRLLTRDGLCLFVCNLRDFKPDVEKLGRAGVEIQDITEQTIPADFERNQKIHHAYIVKRTPLPEGAEPRKQGHGPKRPGGPRKGGPRPDRGGRGGFKPSNSRDGERRNDGGRPSRPDGERRGGSKPSGRSGGARFSDKGRRPGNAGGNGRGNRGGGSSGGYGR